MRLGILAAIAVFIAVIFNIQNSFACEQLSGLDDVLHKTEGQALVFGELHGSAQVPELVTQVACTAALNGEKLLVGLEITRDHNPAFQKFMAADTKAEARQIAEQDLATFWAKTKDGRSSEAIFDLMMDIWSLKHHGHDVALLGFRASANIDIEKIKSEGTDWIYRAEYDFLTQNLSEYDRVIALVGNFHPVKWNAYNDGSIAAFWSEGDKGTSWACFSGQECGVNDVDASRNWEKVKDGPIPSIAFADFVPPGYVGYFVVPSTTASKPFKP